MKKEELFTKCGAVGDDQGFIMNELIINGIEIRKWGNNDKNDDDEDVYDIDDDDNDDDNNDDDKEGNWFSSNIKSYWFNLVLNLEDHIIFIEFKAKNPIYIDILLIVYFINLLDFHIILNMKFLLNIQVLIFRRNN